MLDMSLIFFLKKTWFFGELLTDVDENGVATGLFISWIKAGTVEVLKCVTTPQNYSSDPYHVSVNGCGTLFPDFPQFYVGSNC